MNAPDFVRRAGRFSTNSRRSNAVMHSAVEVLEERRLLSVLPAGGEFLVNSQTDWNQNDPALAMSPDGRFVVVWEGDSIIDEDDIWFQCFDADGTPIGPEMRANTTELTDQRDPVVAMDAAGNFVIAWEDDYWDGSADGVFARRFNAAGRPLGEEFQVNTHFWSSQNDPAIAMAPDGRFVITWKSKDQDGSRDGVFAQRYDPAGMPIGNEFRVNTITLGDQSEPSVAMNIAGAFVITWQRAGQIATQRFGADGTPLGEEIVMTSDVLGSGAPVAALADDGRYTIAWQAYSQDGYNIRAQSFDSTGAATGDVVHVSRGTFDYAPTIAGDSDGGFVIAWEEYQAGQPERTVWARHYGVDGLAGKAFPVPSADHLRQAKPAAAMNAAGDFTIAWESGWQDGSRDGVYAQRYQPAAASGATVEGMVWFDANGNGMFDPNEVGKAGVTVSVYTPDMAVVARAVTGIDGHYEFGALPMESAYTIRFDPKTDSVLTNANQGAEARDSDPDPVSRRTEFFNFSLGQLSVRLDAGVVPQETISGTVVDDRNANRRFDAAERGLAGWVVFLDHDKDGEHDAGEPSAVTDDSGAYRFSGLYRGSHLVTLLAQPMWTFISASRHDITVLTGGSAAGLDFCVHTDAAAPHGSLLSPTQLVLPGLLVIDAAADRSGNYVLASPEPDWRSVSIGLFNADGTSRGPHVLAAEFPTWDTSLTLFDMAMNSSGSVAVVYGSSQMSPLIRRFDASGQEIGSAIPVTNWVMELSGLQILMDDSGGLQVFWSDRSVGVFGRRFSDSGSPQGIPFRVNAMNQRSVTLVDAAANTGNTAAVLWRVESPHDPCLYVRRYQPNGDAVGAEQRIDQGYPTERSVDGARIGIDSQNGFVVAWQEWMDGLASLHVGRCSASGASLGAPVRMSGQHALDGYGGFDLAVAPDGSFAVVFRGLMEGAATEYIRWFNAAGEPLMEDVSSVTHPPYLAPHIILDDGGRLTVIGGLQIGAEYGSYTRRYSTEVGPNLVVTGTSGPDSFTLMRVQQSVQLYHGLAANGDLIGGYPFDALTRLTFGPMQSDDLLLIDFSRGNPIPSGGLFFGGDGEEILLGKLSIWGPGRMALPSGGGVFRTAGLVLNNNASLDIGDNELIVEGAGLEQVAAWIAAGYNGGSWDGPGIVSSAASANPLIGLAVAPVNGSAALRVTRTWNGDANLSGQVDAADYFLIDVGFLAGAAGYGLGDFNHSGMIDGDDYFLIDQAFLGQTVVIAASNAGSQPALAAPSQGVSSKSTERDAVLDPPHVLRAFVSPTGSVRQAHALGSALLAERDDGDVAWLLSTKPLLE